MAELRKCAALLLALAGVTLLGCTSQALPGNGHAPVTEQDAPAPAASRPAPEELVQRRREVRVMGTSLELTVLGTDPARLEEAMDAAEAEMRRIEDLMTSWRPSPLTRLNDAAGEGPQQVPEELAAIVDRALAIGEQTGGAFDITFASVGKLWSFKEGKTRRPMPEELSAALRNVDYRRVRVDLTKNTVELPAGFRIGLGGIAKGYGVDRAMDVLRRHGIQNAVVNAGGDMKVLGTKFGRYWQVAIKHPRKEGKAIALLRVKNSCVVSSGDYERFFLHEGKRYHHILDPRTGQPATGAMSATVVAPNAEHADALATALCVLGPKEGLALVRRLRRVEAILVDMQGELHATDALHPALQASGAH